MNFLGKFFAFVAQLVEQLICNQPVVGSSPIEGSSRRERLLMNPKELTGFLDASKRDSTGDATWFL